MAIKKRNEALKKEINQYTDQASKKIVMDKANKISKTTKPKKKKTVDYGLLLKEKYPEKYYGMELSNTKKIINRFTKINPELKGTVDEGIKYYKEKGEYKTNKDKNDVLNMMLDSMIKQSLVTTKTDSSPSKKASIGDSSLRNDETRTIKSGSSPIKPSGNLLAGYGAPTEDDLKALKTGDVYTDLNTKRKYGLNKDTKELMEFSKDDYLTEPNQKNPASQRYFWEDKAHSKVKMGYDSVKKVLNNFYNFAKKKYKIDQVDFINAAGQRIDRKFKNVSNNKNKGNM